MKYFSVFILTIIILFGCTKNPPKQPDPDDISRVDVQKVEADGKYTDEVLIADAKSLLTIKKAVNNISWSKAKAEMSKREDIKATLFYKWDKNQPELLFEYRIWFNKDDSATIISNNSIENYGQLEKDLAVKLRKALTE
ncbi:hypothetical protein [Peribacillus acanthi]|uniref:hypothetical protein n=1 Tax=Peribacillus acanthi TaxID=2171554 RepID=UPI000D3EC518|nr:hypothetical protein [Peribacillus acanthi]